MKRQMRYMARSQFVRGLSSMLEISGTSHRVYQRGDIMDALRGDMEKIGADMRRAVEREKAREKASRKTFPTAD